MVGSTQVKTFVCALCNKTNRADEFETAWLNQHWINCYSKTIWAEKFECTWLDPNRRKKNHIWEIWNYMVKLKQEVWVKKFECNGRIHTGEKTFACALCNKTNRADEFETTWLNQHWINCCSKTIWAEKFECTWLDPNRRKKASYLRNLKVNGSIKTGDMS